MPYLESKWQVDRRRREHLAEWVTQPCRTCTAPVGTPCTWVGPGPDGQPRELLANLAHAARINAVLATWPDGHHGRKAKR